MHGGARIRWKHFAERMQTDTTSCRQNTRHTNVREIHPKNQKVRSINVKYLNIFIGFSITRKYRYPARFRQSLLFFFHCSIRTHPHTVSPILNTEWFKSYSYRRTKVESHSASGPTISLYIIYSLYIDYYLLFSMFRWKNNGFYCRYLLWKLQLWFTKSIQVSLLPS